MKRRPLLGLCAFLLSSVVGCSDSDISACDVSARACQERIYYSMLRLRNDGYDPFAGLPPIRVISEAEFRDELIAQTTQASTQEPNPWDEALRLLHLYPPAPQTSDAGTGAPDPQIDDQAAHVYAYYEPATKNITIINHPVTTSSREAMLIAMVSLAHEFVHAIQDREMDIQATNNAETSDEYLAASMLIEGDARFYENTFIAQLLGTYTSKAVVNSIDSELNDYFTHFEELGSPYFAAQMFMYPLGAKYLATAWGSEGNAAVRRAYTKAPKHSAGFLLGTDGSRPISEPTLMACDAPLAENGKPTAIDRFGGLLFYTFLRGWDVPHPTAYALAQGWTDDMIRVFRIGADTAVAWRVDLGRSVPAEVLTALSRSGELMVSPNGTAVNMMATTSGTRTNWKTAAGCM